MPVVPFTHNHRRHPIGDFDSIFDNDRPVKFDQQHLDHVRSFRVVEPHHHSLTVSDLLDVYDTDDFSAIDVVSRSSDDDRESANRIFTALVAFRALSPEERAEFDRRTASSG